ncbi:uncharacterized protein LOC106392150 isoform X1 [Brassica napus]|uniref:uncharacterized protein LOC106392150 isoform X1 n=1 Tax=Brassica napus TaxID=3708 RepID=UPI00207A123A|nr:uncharacterized protein LOC106392150 isoform X1 [Brassica napus]XP_048616039.1 uncharacterized protein LOC106392150 isoform X1 [Brassica napus]
MAKQSLLLANLKAGCCSSIVDVQLLRFWEVDGSCGFLFSQLQLCFDSMENRFMCSSLHQQERNGCGYTCPNLSPLICYSAELLAAENELLAAEGTSVMKENVTHETSQSDQNSKSIILRNPGVIIKIIVLLFGVYRNRCHMQLMLIL